MAEDKPTSSGNDLDSAETQEWLDSLDYALETHGPLGVQHLLMQLEEWAKRKGVDIPFSANTAYLNTISVSKQPAYPGDREIERRIKSMVRWNAMAMVVRANREYDGIGGHISTYASQATLIEVGMNHFFHGRDSERGGDIIYFQGHAAPGVYARAFMEGRLDTEHLENFRRELREPGGLPSYPHPWLMPDFWAPSTPLSGHLIAVPKKTQTRGKKDTSS